MDTPFTYVQRVRPQECAASTMLGHPRYLEFFEAAFIECWRARFGQLDATLGPNRRLTAAAVSVRYLAPVRSDEELCIEVTMDSQSTCSIQVQYDAFVEDARVAEASSRYVCVDAESGEPVSFPESIKVLETHHAGLRHRYGDSNPGFRTENPPWEVNLGRFRPGKDGLVQSSAVECSGVGDIFRDTSSSLPSIYGGWTAIRSRRRSVRKWEVQIGSCQSSIRFGFPWEGET